jgi:hypothetical protein
MEIKINERPITIKGNVEIYSFPSDKFPDYESIQKLSEEERRNHLVEKGENMVVNGGLDVVKNLLIGATTTSILYSGVGSGSTAVTSSDTDLETAIGSRLLIQTRYSGGTGIAKFDSFYSAGDNNGSWNEAILAQATSGAIFARKILSSTFTKATTNTAVLSWTLTVTVT